MRNLSHRRRHARALLVTGPSTHEPPSSRGLCPYWSPAEGQEPGMECGVVDSIKFKVDGITYHLIYLIVYVALRMLTTASSR